MEGKRQQAAAAASATSERSVRRWQRGALPSERRRNRRGWRTRPDPFVDVWERDVEPLLRSDPEGELSATTILEWLDERHPGRFGSSHLRTLQRRIRDYRALHGPDRELSQGAISQDALRRARGAVGDAYHKLRSSVRARPLVHTDDTGWRVDGGPAFLMAFETDEATVYQVRARHRNEEVREVVPSDYGGVMVTDRGRSYDTQALSGGEAPAT